MIIKVIQSNCISMPNFNFISSKLASNLTMKIAQIKIRLNNTNLMDFFRLIIHVISGIDSKLSRISKSFINKAINHHVSADKMIMCSPICCLSVRLLHAFRFVFSIDMDFSQILFSFTDGLTFTLEILDVSVSFFCYACKLAISTQMSQTVMLQCFLQRKTQNFIRSEEDLMCQTCRSMEVLCPLLVKLDYYYIP